MKIEEFRKIYPNIKDTVLTPDEAELLKRLAKPWPCMHPLELMEEREYSWRCGKCGLQAPKRVSVFL
jgi:hypothetical protein